VTSSGPDGGIDVTFTVRNTGSQRGSEVPQVYLGPSSRLPAGVQQAVAKLIGFSRVDLSPHRSRRIRLHVDRQQLSSWSGGQWVAGTGTRTLWVGSSSRAPHLHTTFTVR
jgi:beta-glucosidase